MIHTFWNARIIHKPLTADRARWRRRLSLSLILSDESGAPVKI
ncbi:MAG TPA: hypothetical protein VF553_23445 [Pyrinomonadaceae bacterium]